MLLFGSPCREASVDALVNVLNWIPENYVRLSMKLTECETRVIWFVIFEVSALREGRLIDIYYVVG